MAKSIPSLGEFEILVLRQVWQEQPCTERQITEIVQKDRPVARTTVLKTMQRLEAKGFLTRQLGKGSIRFRAVFDERRVMPALIRRFVEGVLGGSPEPLVAFLADSEKLSAKELAVLRAIARKIGKEKEA